jgi:hypothetical protein
MMSNMGGTAPKPSLLLGPAPAVVDPVVVFVGPTKKPAGAAQAMAAPNAKGKSKPGQTAAAPSPTAASTPAEGTAGPAQGAGVKSSAASTPTATPATADSAAPSSAAPAAAVPAPRKRPKTKVSHAKPKPTGTAQPSPVQQ